ncbi:hypothetical protein LC653_45430 [Nostoc sp. CHAB 5784]|uniref:HEAT repeat domain-containing protein n=1 Tax=Nostoc mirabile TaxID=2907820 RepID=UPI001E3E4BC9|nr:HEAT repeat domain-containing protein [Nostoc mirabile]MCC5670808.1 hypothetical protein [Nostoc mirabile CHAB5784]
MGVIENTQDEANYLSVATDLCTIDPSNETAKQILVQLLENTQDEAIYLSAAQKLAMLDPSNKTAVPGLLKILKTTKLSEKFDKTASDILGKIGNGDKTAIQELVGILNTSRGWNKHFSIILETLSAISVGNETASHALLRILETSRSSIIRCMVAEKLSKIDVTGEMTTLAFVRSLRGRSLRIKELHQLMMKCADTKPYEKFYQAFNSYPWSYRIYRNLELIWEVIKNSPFEFYFRIFRKYY